jgi:hypothetical protein
MKSINSPGIQIIETDLSLYQQIGGGTTVFLPGFANQGPIDEVLLVTSISEFETIYGRPETAAERYFYYTAKEIVGTNANLLTTRIPYGSGSGEGFANQYSALLYPVASATGRFDIGAPVHITLDQTQYNDIVQNNFTWGNIGSTLNVPSLNLSLLNAGFIVINEAQTTVNEIFEGYYIGIADNTEFGPNSDFSSVTKFYSLTGSGKYYTVPDSRLGFSLSASAALQGSNSVS